MTPTEMPLITHEVPLLPANEPAAVAPRPNPQLASRAAAGVSVMFGILVLIGWLWNVPELRALGPGTHAAVNPMSAFCFVALGSAMWLLSIDEHVRGREIARALALLVVVIGVARLYGLLFRDAPGVDELLFGNAMRATGDGRLNRMAPNAAFNFALLGTGLIMQMRGSRVGSIAAQLFAVIVLFSAQAALIAHAYQSGWFNGIGSFNRMALPTAISFAALSIGMMTLSSEDGLIGIVLSEGPGGSLARTLLPAAFLVPAVIGWAVIFSRRGGVLDPDVSDTLFVMATILIFVGMVSWIAIHLHESHLARARTEDALRASETRFRLIAENSSDVVSLLDVTGRVVYISPSCERVLGFLPEEMQRMAPFAIVHPEDRERIQRHFTHLLQGEPVTSIQCRMTHKTGKRIWLDMMWRALYGRDGRIARLQVSSRDITDSKQYQRRLEETQKTLQKNKKELADANMRLAALAAMDGLTGVKNRRAFDDRLEEELARARRHGTSLSLLLLDIDHFKAYNDAFGHPKGDDVLRQVGRLLLRTMRDTDIAARYGGEEFALILPLTDLDGARQLGERLRAAIEGASWDDRAITVSVGVTTFGRDADSPERMIELADRALYNSKLQGRNRVSVAAAA